MIFRNILNNHLRYNYLLTYYLFGLKIKSKERIHWDFTTLILKKVLRKYIKDSNEILEIGTGPFALLSIYISMRFHCNIKATDINDNYVNSAINFIKYNNKVIPVVQSDLFEKIKDVYDIIFFNSVYISEERGNNSNISKLHRYKTDWCGGKNGYETIEKFLSDSRYYLKDCNSIIMLGLNPHYVNLQDIYKICILNKLNIVKKHKSFLNPCIVLIIILNIL